MITVKRMLQNFQFPQLLVEQVLGIPIPDTLSVKSGDKRKTISIS